MRASRLGSFVLAGCLVLLWSGSALALDSTAARRSPSSPSRAPRLTRCARRSSRRFATSRPLQRSVAAGDMLLRNRDYDQAIITLNKVLELHRRGKMPEQALADATFLLGEAYFQSHQYLAARRDYREVLDKADQAPFASYAGRSVSRLVDIALRTDDLESPRLRVRAARQAAGERPDGFDPVRARQGALREAGLLGGEGLDQQRPGELRLHAPVAVPARGDLHS